MFEFLLRANHSPSNRLSLSSKNYREKFTRNLIQIEFHFKYTQTHANTYYNYRGRGTEKVSNLFMKTSYPTRCCSDCRNTASLLSTLLIKSLSFSVRKLRSNKTSWDIVTTVSQLLLRELHINENDASNSKISILHRFRIHFSSACITDHRKHAVEKSCLCKINCFYNFLNT